MTPQLNRAELIAFLKNTIQFWKEPETVMLLELLLVKIERGDFNTQEKVK